MIYICIYIYKRIQQFPGGLMVKDTALSLLWLGLLYGPGSISGPGPSACCRHGQKPTKQKRIHSTLALIDLKSVTLLTHKNLPHPKWPTLKRRELVSMLDTALGWHISFHFNPYCHLSWSVFYPHFLGDGMRGRDQLGCFPKVTQVVRKSFELKRHTDLSIKFSFSSTPLSGEHLKLH